MSISIKAMVIINAKKRVNNRVIKSQKMNRIKNIELLSPCRLSIKTHNRSKSFKKIQYILFFELTNIRNFIQNTAIMSVYGHIIFT